MNDKELNKMTDAHWDYIREVLYTHDVGNDTINKIGFHYKSAMKHGYKHAKEEYEKK